MDTISVQARKSGDKAIRSDLFARGARLLNKTEATWYLNGVPPEAIGIGPISAQCRKTRYDQRAIDIALDRLSNIEMAGAASPTTPYERWKATQADD